MIIVTHAYGNRKGVRFLSNGVKVYYLPALVLHSAATLPTHYGLFAIFRNIFIRERVDIVHGHQAPSSLCHEAILHARTMGLKACFTEHSLYGFADVSSIVMNKVLKYTLSDIDHVICVSHTRSGPPEHTHAQVLAGRVRQPLSPAVRPPLRRSFHQQGEPGPPCGTQPAQCLGHPQRRRHDAVHAQPVRPRQPSRSVACGLVDPRVHGCAQRVGAGGRIHGGRIRLPVTIVVLSRLVYRKGIDLLVSVIPEVCQRFEHVHFLIGALDGAFTSNERGA